MSVRYFLDTNIFVYSLNDALIIAAAKKAGCTILYTVDLQDGQKIDRLLIKNPFSG